MTKSESSIQKQILQYLQTLPRCVPFKVIIASQRGVPDILCCLNGRFVGLEVKRPGAKTVRIQQAQHQRITAAGGAVYVVHSLDEVKNLVITKDLISRRQSDV